jgi:hypothetical protein
MLPFLFTGCIFHKKQPQPVQALAPAASSAPKPEPDHPNLPDSATTIPPQPIKSTEDENLPAKPISRHKRQAAKPPQDATTAPATTPASDTPASDTPAVSAIGQLSTPEPSDLRRSIDESIASTDRGLNNIGRSLNDQDQKTAAQIRGFLKQAKAALTTGDVDGAKTLASKAKVLLSELNH